MDTPKHPGRMLFVNLPVSDLERSTTFFTELGFTFDPLFADESGVCMLVGEHAFYMLLTHEKYSTFTSLPIADPRTYSAALHTFTAESRQQVNELVERAVSIGGEPTGEPVDYGEMYSRCFLDPDGHHWEVMWMDPAALEQGRQELAEPDAPAGAHA